VNYDDERERMKRVDKLQLKDEDESKTTPKM